MSLFSTNRCKSLSAEYVEESCKVVPDVSEADDITVNESVPDVSEADDVTIDESFLDSFLESLNNEE